MSSQSYVSTIGQGLSNVASKIIGGSKTVLKTIQYTIYNIDAYRLAIGYCNPHPLTLAATELTEDIETLFSAVASEYRKTDINLMPRFFREHMAQLEHGATERAQYIFSALYKEGHSLGMLEAMELYTDSHTHLDQARKCIKDWTSKLYNEDEMSRFLEGHDVHKQAELKARIAKISQRLTKAKRRTERDLASTILSLGVACSLGVVPGILVYSQRCLANAMVDT